MIELNKEKERVVLVGVCTSEKEESEDLLNELSPVQMKMRKSTGRTVSL